MTAAKRSKAEPNTRPRGIIRQVEDARRGPAAAGGTARIPSRIEFEFNSDRLTDEGKPDLNTFSEALSTELRDTGVSLEGHTDAIGTGDYNQALSERRAAQNRHATPSDAMSTL